MSRKKARTRLRSPARSGPVPSPRIAVEIANQQSWIRLESGRIERTVRRVLEAERVRRAHIELAIVDDRAIRRLHRRFLGKDTATDVLTFELAEDDGRLSGEIVVSAETARRAAPRYGLDPADELLLYVIHGILHLCGYDDRIAADRRRMERRQLAHLRRFGGRSAAMPSETC